MTAARMVARLAGPLLVQLVRSLTTVTCPGQRVLRTAGWPAGCGARHRLHEPEPVVDRAGDADIVAVLGACRSARDRLIVLLMARAGLRRGEPSYSPARPGCRCGTATSTAEPGPRPCRRLAYLTCTLISVRSVRRDSRVERDFACTLAGAFPPVLVVLRAQSRLGLEGRTRTLSGPSPDLSPVRAFAPFPFTSWTV
jgi:hypothetical protein